VRSFIQPRRWLLPWQKKPAHGYELNGTARARRMIRGPKSGLLYDVCASSRKRGWYGRRGTRKGRAARPGGCTRSPTRGSISARLGGKYPPHARALERFLGDYEAHFQIEKISLPSRSQRDER